MTMDIRRSLGGSCQGSFVYARHGMGAPLAGGAELGAERR